MSANYGDMAIQTVRGKKKWGAPKTHFDPGKTLATLKVLVFLDTDSPKEIHYRLKSPLHSKF